jgi:transcriptional regulator with XRE-family HTH domain
LADDRKRQKITQVELAHRLGRLQSFVSNYERGSRQLDVIEFIDVAKALGLDPVMLLQQLAS